VISFDILREITMRFIGSYIALFIALVNISSTFALEVIQLQTQLSTLSSLTSSSTDLPPLDLKSWFEAHAYLNADNETEMENRSIRRSSGKDDFKCLQITLKQFKSMLQQATDIQFAQFNQSSPKKEGGQYCLQKLIVPPTSTIHFFGDLHANISSLVFCLAQLRALNIIDENFNVVDGENGPHYIFFGGDFADRGFYGAEILQTICRLKINNPERVFLIRGNHESPALNYTYYFLNKEVPEKFFSDNENAQKKIRAFVSLLNDFYGSLPVAIFLGVQNQSHTNYLLLCHGGLEFYDPTLLFEQKTIVLPRKGSTFLTHLASKIIDSDISSVKKFVSELPQEVMVIGYDKWPFVGFKDFEEKVVPYYYSTCGFMWNDFNAGGKESFSLLKDFYDFLHKSDFNRNRGFYFGSDLGNAMLDKMTQNASGHTIIGVIRAHQHNDTMQQLLSAEFNKTQEKYSIVNSANQSIYKMPLAAGYKYHIFTTVSTSAFTPSPSFIRVEMALDPNAWILTNSYIEDFQTHVSKEAIGDETYRNELYSGQHWKNKTQPLVTWQNAFDGNAGYLVHEQNKLRAMQTQT